MKIDKWKTIRLVSFSLCLCATIGLSVYSILRYCKNEDVTLVQISQYHSLADKIYPSISICILPPFLIKEFERHKDTMINISSYIEFLRGNHWDERMLDISYNNVTVSLKENLLDSYYWTFEENSFGNQEFNWKPNVYVSFRSYDRKCFTIDAPYADNQMLWKFDLFINNNIFPNGRRTPDTQVYLHYPGQIFTSYYTIKHEWDLRVNKTKSYSMTFNIRNVDVITHRNKPQDPCVEDWKKYDEYVMNVIMLESGCRPYHWILNTFLPKCSNSVQMAKFAKRPAISKVMSLHPPCKSIDRLDYDYFEADESRQFES